MSSVQVRGLSETAHRRLKARAALDGRSLSEYLRLELEDLAGLPTLEETLDRVAALEPVGGEPAAEALRAEREKREAG
ncbi:MAG: FitA-like ribbon-helix-helix domain-containing protein [Thermoleophilaceae bacterium]